MTVEIVDQDGSFRRVPMEETEAVLVRKGETDSLRQIYSLRRNSDGALHIYTINGAALVNNFGADGPLRFFVKNDSGEVSGPMIRVGTSYSYFEPGSPGLTYFSMRNFSLYVLEDQIDWKTSRKLFDETGDVIYSIVKKNHTRLSDLSIGNKEGFKQLWEEYHGKPLQPPSVPMFRELWRGGPDIHISEVQSFHVHMIPTLGVRVIHVEYIRSYLREKVFVERITKRKFDMAAWLRKHNMYPGWFVPIVQIDGSWEYWYRRRQVNVAQLRRERCK